MTSIPDITSQSRDGWATFIVAETIDHSHIDRFEEWVARANAQLTHNEGFLGLDKVRSDDTNNPRYVTLIHFDNQRHLDQWVESPQHLNLVAEIEPYIADATTNHAQGLEVWFTLPETNRRHNPGYWRQIIITTPVVFSLILGLGAILAPVLEDLPTLAATAVSVTIATMLLTWPVMPWITRIFQSFLYPNH